MKTLIRLSAASFGLLAASFSAQAANPVLTIKGLSNSGDNTAFVDQIEILSGGSGNIVVASAIFNNSFENSDPLFSTTFGYVPTGAGWSFGGGSGISVEGSSSGFNPPSAPQGTRVAFLQNATQIQQTLNLGAGTYRLRIRTAQRNFPTGTINTQRLQFLIDGVVLTVGTGNAPSVQPTTATFATANTFTTNSFVVDAAASFAASSFEPGRNARNVARNAPVSLNFSEEVSAASAATINIFSSQLGGLRTVPAVLSTNTVSFKPNLFFKAGEVVSVTRPNTVVSNALEQATNDAQVYQFTVAAQNNGAGNGTFNGTQNPGVGTDPGSVATGDVDGDGRLDLVVVNRSSNSVSILRNLGLSGTPAALVYAAKADFALPNGSQPYEVALGDIDGDGDLDIVTANYGTNRVSIFQNTITAPGPLGSGSFATSVEFVTGTDPGNVVLGDLDADGDLDIVTANFGGNNITVLRNVMFSANTQIGNGNAPSTTLTTSGFVGANIATGTDPAGVALGDLNNDGLLDIAVTNSNPNTVSVFRNTTSSPAEIEFAARVNIGVGNTPYGIALGDINGDGRLDIVTANYGTNTSGTNNVTVLQNTTTSITGNFTATSSTLTVGARPISVAIADVNGDGLLDILAANYSNGTGRTVSTLLRNATNTGFATQVVVDLSTTTNIGPRSIAVADLDGDGDLDFATANFTTNAVSFRINGSSGPVLPLPVELVSFTAECGTAGTTLAWRTASEKNNRGFELQRSADSKTFSTVAFVEGLGTSVSGRSYTHTDKAPAGYVYYRLRQLDTDGKESFSPVATATCAGISAELQKLTLLPNPARGRVQVLGTRGNTLQLLDLTGRVLRTQTAVESMDLTGLTPGMYLVRNGNQTARLVVE